VLRYRHGPESDPFHYVYSSPGWLESYDPPRPFPFFINLELTNSCQLNCLFCSGRRSSRKIGFLEERTARSIFKEAGAHEGAAVRFTGWGEPLGHPRAAKFAALAKKEGLKLKIYTNGMLLNEKMMRELIDAGVDDLQFSLQGLNRSQYEFNRRGGDYELLERNIKMASEMRGKGERPFISILTSVLETELKEEDPLEFCRRWLSHADKVAVDLTNLNFVKDFPDARPHLESQSPALSRRRCVDVFLALEVKYDGLIQFCGQDADNRENHTVGRFGDLSLAEAWLGDRMEAQRDLVGRSLGHVSRELCSACYHNTNKYDLFRRKGA
jgi:MoaA/NifB/PqqE/SkfB family radical SAM enzyme